MRTSRPLRGGSPSRKSLRCGPLQAGVRFLQHVQYDLGGSLPVRGALCRSAVAEITELTLCLPPSTFRR